MTASKPARTRRPLHVRAAVFAALGLALAAVLPAAHAGCKYRKEGSIPLHWDGPRPMLDGSANGTPIRVLVDTGADNLVIGEALAERLGLTLGHLGREQFGTGGASRASRAHLKQLVLGKFEWTNVPVLVLHTPGGGGWDMLVGPRFLLQRDVEMTADALTFYKPADCDDVPLGFWAPDVPWVDISLPSDTDPRLYVTVKIDGKPVWTGIDTGATATTLDLATARELGFDEHAPGVVKDSSSGVGGRVSPAWRATFGRVEIGPEIVRNARIEVQDLWGSAQEALGSVRAAETMNNMPRMLLGADFLRAHHVLFAVSQHRMYFSYSGGEIFSAPTQATGELADALAPAASAPAR